MPRRVQHKRESSLEAEGREYAMARGWFEVKLMRCSKDGMPDRLLCRRPEGVIFIEWKRPGAEGELRTSQIRRHKELRDHGATVYVFDNLDDAKKVLY